MKYRCFRYRFAFVFAAIGLVSACGGGSDGGGQSTPEAPTASIVFPPHSALTNDPEIRVVGTARDLQDDEIQAVTVNGVAATSDDGFATWQVALTLEPGTNELIVQTRDAEGNTEDEAATSEIKVEVVTSMGSSGGNAVLVDQANHRALVATTYPDALLAFDLATGERTVLSASEALDKVTNLEPVGQGPSFTLARNLVPGISPNQVILTSGVTRTDRRFLAVDVTTGERSSFLEQIGGAGSGPAFDLFRSGIMDSARNRFLVMDGFNGRMRVFGVDLDTKNRTLLSGSGVGSGPTLNEAENVFLDSVNNRLYTTDRVGDNARLLSVNLANGERAIVSDANTGTGPAILYPTALDYDPVTNRFLLTGLDALFSIDPATGDRTVLSGDVPGTDQRIGAGVGFESPEGAAFLGSQQAVVIDEILNAPTIVDLATGDRQVLPTPSIGEGPRLQGPRSMVRNGDQLIVADSEANQLFSVNLASGDREVLLDGSDSQMNVPRSLALDLTGERLFIADNLNEEPRVLSISLESKALSVVSGAGVGSGDALEKPQQLAFDASSGRLYLVDRGTGQLLWIDPATGDRTSISSFDSEGLSLALTDNSQEAMVISGLALFRVNLATGERTFVSGSNPDTDEVIGGKYSLSGTEGMVFDSENNRVFRASPSDYDIMAIDLSTGAQERVAKYELSIGPGVENPVSLLMDDSGSNLLVLDAARCALMTVNPENGDSVISSWTEVQISYKY